MFRRQSDKVDEFLNAARSHLGYQCRPGNVSVFGSLTGYQGLPWDGSFIDVVARDSGVSLPPCVYTPTGIAEFIRLRRMHTRPQPGDIVFFNWSTGDNFGSPHVGIVSDVTDWDRLKRIRVIEGMVNSGLAKGSPVNDGVFERTRYGFDVIGFGRPNFNVQPAKGNIEKADGQPVVRLSNIQPGKKHRDMVPIQLALGIAVSLRNAKQGALDGQTMAAYARYQRSIGYVGTDVTGIPDLDSLTRLGRETGCFGVA